MTYFTEIYDLFLVNIKDPNINKLYINQEEFKTYLQGFLVKAIPKFTNCKKDLSNRDDIAGTFNIDLDDTEKDILSNLMVIEWLTKEINNINQMNLHLQGRDFKTYSEAQNLKEKSDLRDKMREIVDLQMTQYSLKHVPWELWSTGNYANN